MAKSSDVKRGADPKLDEWGDPIQAPPIVEGYLHAQEGTLVIGVILERADAEVRNGKKFSPYYVVKVQTEVEVSRGGEYVSLPAGSVIGIPEVNGLRPLASRAASGPLKVRIHYKRKLPDKSWDLDVRAVPAF